jgi:hypothetical protein
MPQYAAKLCVPRRAPTVLCPAVVLSFARPPLAVVGCNAMPRACLISIASHLPARVHLSEHALWCAGVPSCRVSADPGPLVPHRPHGKPVRQPAIHRVAILPPAAYHGAFRSGPAGSLGGSPLCLCVRSESSAYRYRTSSREHLRRRGSF